jgi:magnesium-transporting ATPase (P-type)
MLASHDQHNSSQFLVQHESRLNSFSPVTVSVPLQVNVEGLTSAQATERLAEYGPNKLPESTRNPLLVYLGYMWNPLSWAMEVAAIIAIALLDYADFCLIVALLFLNATISFVEESNADKAIKALTAALAPKAKCLRDGKVDTIDAQHLVPGDIVVVRLGEIVPADIKLMGESGEDDHPLQARYGSYSLPFVAAQGMCQLTICCSFCFSERRLHMHLPSLYLWCLEILLIDMGC